MRVQRTKKLKGLKGMKIFMDFMKKHSSLTTFSEEIGKKLVIFEGCMES